ncbi:biopolymer transporter ExbD [Myroides sp. 1354]|uniref:biopolymer transporter ExbD n=1 Tax=unclassified Myroides TaxID=2642485 RepID=UPI002576A431|nr:MULTISPECIES: biopolymer transporter ExbD [unclassified Myroides]MDM1044136.1 biopolymer transporter ExbD [Myroides sp. R163-1]MDM1055072.1 biopolymer transporter ExbD [Myroides sp. 1354]MDM1068369.1 biopolymer transporter ExbD [Myroides sp. 1372]
MAKGKMKKKSMSVDMTAMCDVSFLLLTFFVLTSTAKLPEPLPVDTPNSTVQTKLPESNLATVTIGGEPGAEKVFFGVLGKEDRIATLEKMGSRYQIEFNDEEKQVFAYTEGIGTPINELKKFLNLPADVRNKIGADQPGVPTDSVNNQLKDWVEMARTVAKERNNKVLDVAIKGDAEANYPAVKKVIDILQEQRVNKFFLVTGLRNEDF